MSYVNEEIDAVMITPLAVEKVRAIMVERDVQDHILRVFVAGASCSGIQYGMAFEKNAQEGDTVITLDGLTVVVDAHSLPFVNGVNIDFVETPQGEGFSIKNPNASPGALCGGGCSSC